MKRPTWLISLLEKGTAAHSTVDRRIVNELLTLGIVCLRSTGLKQSVCATDPVQLRLWVEARYPLHAIDADKLPTREGNIVRSGSSKYGHSSHTVLPFQFKWFGQGSLARMTSDYGMMSVFTDRIPDLPVPTRWRLLTIENWEPFYRSNYPAAPIPVMAAYLGGNVSDSVIEALNKFRNPPEQVLHFGDYDWEGLYIFQRLEKAIACARLYVPSNIEALFATFGSRKLIEKQKRKPGFDLSNPKCQSIIQHIEQYNAGLEQEVVELPHVI